MLRPHLLLLLLAWTTAFPAAGAAPAASRATVTFVVTAEGSQRTVVTASRSGRDEFGCTVRRSDVERQTLTFASRGGARLVTSVPGGLATARIGVRVRASATGRSTRTFSGPGPDCDLAPETSERRCRPVTLAGHVIVRLPAPGTVGLAGSLDRRRDAARCAPAVAPARRFLTASEGHFPAAHLTDRTAGRIILRGDARFTDTLASGARRVTTVRWTVVLRRLA